MNFVILNVTRLDIYLSPLFRLSGIFFCFVSKGRLVDDRGLKKKVFPLIFYLFSI